MNTEAALGNVMVDCPDAEMLQRFYGELLGWEQCQLYGCPAYASGECAGCDTAHRPGDCFTRDCVEKRGVAFCTLCRDFPCDGLLRREKATVLDKAWLQWKQQEQNLAEGAQDEGDNLPL